jgi:hypothetical protein
MERLRALTGMTLVVGEMCDTKSGPNAQFILAGKGMVFKIEPPQKKDDGV